MKNTKQLRKAEQEVINIEMAIMWHKRAVRHKGFTNYSGLMSREELTAAREKHSNLKAFIRENRKIVRANAA